jgi:hypothetical protein
MALRQGGRALARSLTKGLAPTRGGGGGPIQYAPAQDKAVSASKDAETHVCSLFTAAEPMDNSTLLGHSSSRSSSEQASKRALRLADCVVPTADATLGRAVVA